jgi:hypothetical protein
VLGRHPLRTLHLPSFKRQADGEGGGQSKEGKIRSEREGGRLREREEGAQRHGEMYEACQMQGMRVTGSRRKRHALQASHRL